MAVKLYWVTTLDHHEDWFIFAKNSQLAESRHELEVGYNVGDASASFVCDVPDTMNTIEGWPELSQLKALGAKILRDTSPRKIEVNGKVFTEGCMDALIGMPPGTFH